MAELTFDQLLKIGEIVSILGGGAVVAFKLGRTSSRFESALASQSDILEKQAIEISELKLETKKLGDVLTSIAVQGTRLDRVEGDIRELRHGRGYVIDEIGGGSRGGR